MAGRARSKCAASAWTTCRSTTTGASAADSSARARCGAPRSPPRKRPSSSRCVRFLRAMRRAPKRWASASWPPTSRRRRPTSSTARRASTALDALGTFAERLARRASSGAVRTKAADAALSAHLDVAARYGVKFTSIERGGRMQRLLRRRRVPPRARACAPTPEQRARAALALTREECVDPDLRPTERRRVDEWRADVLDGVDVARLPAYLRNRVLMRRAARVEQPRLPARAQATSRRMRRPARAIARARPAIDKSELTDDDMRTYADAAMRVERVALGRGARFGAVGAEAAAALVTAPGERRARPASCSSTRSTTRRSPLAQRCTYGVVWAAFGHAESRRHRARARRAADRHLARDVGVPQDADGWTVARAAARLDGARSRLCRVRGLGARRQADAGRARGERRRQVRGAPSS